MITTPQTPPWTIDTPHPACFIAPRGRRPLGNIHWCPCQELTEFGKHNTMEISFHQRPRPGCTQLAQYLPRKSVASFSLN